jgi:hypothetical protein
MGYAHIDNLYKAQDILMFKECYALEKIHGTSAHVSWNDGKVGFFAGGASYPAFVALFDAEALAIQFAAIGQPKVTIYGEAYGGKEQGMKATYGDKLRFVAFDVLVGTTFVGVLDAVDIVSKLGLEFVAFEKIPTELAAIDALRDAPSEQSFRNGVSDRDNPGSWKMREGVVLRPLVEVYRVGRDNGRIIAKHKRAEFSERKSTPSVDPAQREVLEKAEAVADEWVTPMRLAHVLDKLGNPRDMAKTPDVIKAMLEDVTREAAGEIVDSKDVRKAIGSACVKLYKKLVMEIPVG